MKTLKRYFLPILVAWILAACAGTGGSGPGVGGGSAGDSGLGAPGASVPAGGPTLGQASGDGTLSSQSSNVDLVPGFFRQYSLFFAGEQLNQGAGYNYILPEVPGTLPSAQVLKIFKGPSEYKEVPCLACEGQHVRAVNCGPHSDGDILQLIPPEEQNSSSASNLLLWFMLHIPRPTGNSAVTVCEGAVYRDFPVKGYGMVDLKELELFPNEIVVFYLLPENLPAEVPPLSTSGTIQISKEGIAATAQNGLIRFVRPTAALQLNPQHLHIIKVP